MAAKQVDRARWLTHETESYDALATVFDSLAQMSRDVAQAMRDKRAKRVTVEHWKATEDGIAAAQRFLLASLTKAGNNSKPEIESALKEIASRVSTNPKTSSPPTKKE